MTAEGRLLGVGALSSAGAAVLTWVCCVPIVAGLLGATVASVGARLEPGRPYFLVAGAAFVAFALVRSYRAPAECADGSCTPAAPRRRLFLWSCAAAIVFAAAMPYLIAVWVQATL